MLIKLIKYILSGLLLMASMKAAAGAKAGEIQPSIQKLSYEDKTYSLEVYKTKEAEFRRKPALILVPEYWGKDALSAAHARRLAKEGYVVMVVDLYGENAHSGKWKKAADLQAEAEGDGIGRILTLISRSLEILKADREVNAAQIGAVGFGYGGGLLLNLAKQGEPSIKAVVSFYGGTKNLRPIANPGRFPAFLYVRPEKDAYTNAGEIKAFEQEMKISKAPFQVLKFKEAHHGFVNPGIERYGKDEGNTFMYYEPKSAALAWQRTLQFLKTNLK